MYTFYRRLYRIYAFLFLAGFSGNHPFFTRFSCWKSSSMDQKEEKATTPDITDHSPGMKSDNTANSMPARRTIHQHRLPS